MWVDILVGLLPRGVFGTSPVREVGFGELVLSTAPISRGSWWRSVSERQSCGTVGRTVGQRFLLDRVLALWHWCCFRGTVVCSLGIAFRLPVLSLGDR